MEESTMEAINPGNLVKMNDEEKEDWIEAIRAELKSFEEMEVFDEVTQEEAKDMKKKGGEVKRVPARLIL
eukprot:1626947-Prorocentrum_lima.AAC.1